MGFKFWLIICRSSAWLVVVCHYSCACSADVCVVSPSIDWLPNRTILPSCYRPPAYRCQLYTGLIGWSLCLYGYGIIHYLALLCRYVRLIDPNIMFCFARDISADVVSRRLPRIWSRCLCTELAGATVITVCPLINWWVWTAIRSSIWLLLSASRGSILCFLGWFCHDRGAFASLNLRMIFRRDTSTIDLMPSHSPSLPHL